MAQRHEEAMETLRSIFPEWDPRILSDVLEVNGGNLETSIDMALGMEPPTSSASASASGQGMTTVPLSPPLPPTRASPPRQSPRPVHSQQRRSRVTLPDDFLCLPGEPLGQRPLSEQEQRDAVLAQMLQDEMFREQLMEDQDFSAHFQGGQRNAAVQRNDNMGYDKTASEIASETFNAMSTRLSSMSEVMKRKMQETYLKFQARSDTSGKDPYSHRPLMADDSSDDEDEGGQYITTTNVDLRHRHAQDSTDGYASSRTSEYGMTRRNSASGNKKSD